MTLEIFVTGVKVSTLHVTHMLAHGRFIDRYLKFSNFDKTKVLTVDTLGRCMWFVDYTTSSVYKNGLSVR